MAEDTTGAPTGPDDETRSYQAESEQRPGEDHGSWTQRAQRLESDLRHLVGRDRPTQTASAPAGSGESPAGAEAASGGEEPPPPDLPYPPAAPDQAAQ